MSAAAATFESETSDRWGPFVLGSLALHAGIFALLIGYTWWMGRGPSFGDPKALGGGAVTVTVVNSIPLPQRPGVENRVSRDTPNETPQEKMERIERRTLDDDEGIALSKKKRPKKKTREEAALRRYLPEEDLTNRITSSQGRAATSAMLQVQNAGNLGTGENNPFGDRFGAYAKLIRDAVARQWRTNDVPQSIRSLPAAIVTFVIARNGRVTDVKVVQSSGNYALDQSAQRAVLEASPLPSLPPQFERNSATVEFVFELKR